jgi:hypothetical protein
VFEEDDMAKITYVEWRDGRPFEVHHGEEYLDLVDIDYCKANQILYWHTSGGRPNIDNGEGLDKLPQGITTFQQLIDWFKMEESATVHCTICKDCFPSDETCEHIVWDEEIGWWGGPGYSE